jgi:hypothetical protein
LGGFFILRLQTYSQTWRELRLEIERLTSVVEATQTAIDKLYQKVESPFEIVSDGDISRGARPDETTSSQFWELKRRRDDALRELRPKLHLSVHATFPVELTLMAGLLLLLLLTGVGAPLMALPRPPAGEKLVYVCLVGGLFVALGCSMMVLALASWKRLRSPLPSVPAVTLREFLDQGSVDSKTHG